MSDTNGTRLADMEARVKALEAENAQLSACNNKLREKNKRAGELVAQHLETIRDLQQTVNTLTSELAMQRAGAGMLGDTETRTEFRVYEVRHITGQEALSREINEREKRGEKRETEDMAANHTGVFYSIVWRVPVERIEEPDPDTEEVEPPLNVTRLDVGGETPEDEDAPREINPLREKIATGRTVARWPRRCQLCGGLYTSATAWDIHCDDMHPGRVVPIGLPTIGVSA